MRNPEFEELATKGLEARPMFPRCERRGRGPGDKDRRSGYADPEVTRRLRRMLQMRLALGVAVFALGPVLFREYAAAIGLFTGALLLLTVVYAVLLRRHFHPRLFANVQIFADVFLVTVLISLTGWEDSRFTFLYIIPIITTSLFFQLRQSVSIALLSSLLYAAVILFHRHREGGGTGFQTMSHGQAAHATSAIETFYSLYIRTVIFCMVGYLCGHLANLLQKQKEELRELKNLHHLILSSMNSGVLTTDASDRIIYANRAAAKILRLPASQMCGWSLGDLFVRADQKTQTTKEDMAGEDLSPSFFTQNLPGDPKIQNSKFKMGQRGELCARTAEGRIVPIGFNLSALPNQVGETLGKVMVFSDLTEVKELERRLRAIDKFRAAGELAAGIAHEIRNPLASITGATEMLLESNGLSETNRELLSVVMSESARLNRIIEDFLAYARRGNLDLGKEDLCQVVKQAIELVGRSGKLPPGVRVELVTPPEPAIVSADRSCMMQVFLNLLNNAVEALDGEGMVLVKVESPLPANDRYTVTISDTGCGIPPGKVNQVFEPFFTTKKNGVGIGLCIAERIVREHNGHIDVASEAGKGTSVTVVIPVDQGSAESDVPHVSPPAYSERVTQASSPESFKGRESTARRRSSEDATERISRL